MADKGDEGLKVVVGGGGAQGDDRQGRLEVLVLLRKLLRIGSGIPLYQVLQMRVVVGEHGGTPHRLFWGA